MKKKSPAVNEAIPTNLQGNNTMKKLSNNSHAQCARLLAYLEINQSINSATAREELDIYHPPARIYDLRQQGHKIITHWETIDTDKGTHRVARWVYMGRVEK